jgi:hypothetical protein
MEEQRGVSIGDDACLYTGYKPFYEDPSYYKSVINGICGLDINSMNLSHVRISQLKYI